jgi:hypothetical protein
VNECTPEGWRDKAGAAVADPATQWENGRYSGPVPRRIAPGRPKDRSNLVHDPNYPNDEVIREVARKLASLFCGESDV